MQMNDWIISLALKKRLEFFSGYGIQKNLETDVEFFFFRKRQRRRKKKSGKREFLTDLQQKGNNFFSVAIEESDTLTCPISGFEWSLS